MRTLIYFIFMFISFTSLSFSQDSTCNNNDDFWKDFDNWDDYNVTVSLRGNPSIGLYGGLNFLSNKATNVKFNPAGGAELKLGYTDIYDYKKDYILRYKNNYLMLANISKDIYKKEDKNKIDLSAWQFGLGYDNGYGYKLGEFNLILYKGGEALWTSIKTDLNSGFLTPADSNELSLYNESFRFGTSGYSGILFQVANTVALDINYKRSVVFSRHMFWYHLGSMIIEWAGEGMIEKFSKKVLNSSPAAGPIVNFVLKTALSYGIYELRKDKMNWPFNTASPIFNEQFNIGLKFTF